MMQAIEHLMQVFECQVFELCGPYHNEGQTDYYVPYMMNDAVEDYLVLKNCRMIGEYIANTELEQDAQLVRDESHYVLAVRQGTENAFTVYFDEIEERVQCYQYHEIGHFWVKGQEQWRQLVYMIGTIHDKYTFLGEAFCNPKELELLKLIEFAPFREWSPIHDSLEDVYPETREGIATMEAFAKRAGDEEFLKWIRMYRRFPRLKKILRNQLLNPQREELYRLIYDLVREASLVYPKRKYDEGISDEIEKIREQAKAEVLKRGFQGEYPEFEEGERKIFITEEQPFTIMEWNHYKFQIHFMISECKKPLKNRKNSGFFKGKGRKGWVERYDYKS